MPVKIVRRKVDLRFGKMDSDTRPGGMQGSEFFYYSISFFFPAGEKFFIDSVQNYQKRITDPVLLAQVKDFVYQEAMHTTMHQRFNEAVLARFPEMQMVGKVGDFLLGLTRRFMPKLWQLAVTCALEHFTALFANELLRRQESFEANAEPNFAYLWLWHSVEELEHKAVCFDLYEQVAGKGVFAYLVRVLAMLETTLLFLLAIKIGMWTLKRKVDSATPAADTARPDGGRKPPKSVFKLVPFRLYFDYYRPSFHPWNHDNRHLLEEWYRRHPDSTPPAAPEPVAPTV
ncbi:MAG TPA: metal-dependent hydrolase [Halothiobacillus sp.]|nr:metal-dependent hydrolase [Halothiobacillus sp.]